ncbi:MAG: hypothetical protein R3D71_06395 [Rickettsiales bacterium]
MVKQSLKDSELYKIKGGSEQECARVRESMEFLLSPAAKGIGKNLLRDAYRVHKKPVSIEINNYKDNVYNNLMGEHTVSVTPESLKGNNLTIRLARELKHAGQADFKEKSWNIAALIEQYHDSYSKKHSDKRQGTDSNNIGEYVRNFLQPEACHIKYRLNRNPVYIDYVNTIEKPAILVEKVVSAILGKIKKRADNTGISVGEKTIQSRVEQSIGYANMVRANKNKPPIGLY